MKRPFSSENRNDQIEQLKAEQLDLLVIGGGITGAGIALDATVRGLRVGLVEMQDFSAGTSSRSTKLIHGGLRYLKQLDVKLVSEVGKERAIVYENAPHVTTPEKMILPIYKKGSFGRFSTSIGLKIYDRLADVQRDERRDMLSRRQTLKEEPLLKADKLKGSGMYIEYRTDDARLTIEAMKEAVKRGTTALNYMKVESLIYENGEAVGVFVVDQITKEAHKIFAKTIVNATGVWLDILREQDRSKVDKTIILSKGVHIVVDRTRMPIQHAIYFDSEIDGRMIFAIPRGNKVYIGTTDTFYEGDLEKPRMTTADLEYLIAATNRAFPSVQINVADVESSWAGLRPLIQSEKKTPGEISRKDEIFISESGLISIAGGKLTGYRKMAERITDLVCKRLQIEKECETEQIALSGGYVGGGKGFDAFIKGKIKEGIAIGLSEDEALRLARFYGSNVSNIFARVHRHRKKALEFNIPSIIYAQLRYAIEEEMAQTPLDFFMRRTGSLYFEIDWVKKWKEHIIHCMCDVLKWSQAEREQYEKELDEEIYYATHTL